MEGKDHHFIPMTELSNGNLVGVKEIDEVYYLAFTTLAGQAAVTTKIKLSAEAATTIAYLIYQERDK
jgi:alkanesulfonate monooxygenase SsuD/methylene tetrahydromethanopterin reductase-like flavin-dependent oxidoreductase (luciferase family)